MQTGQATESNQNTAGALVLAGGVLAILSAFLDWTKFSEKGFDTVNFKGTDLNAGTGALVFGVLLLIFGILLFVRGKTTGGKGSSITAIVMSAFILFAAAYSALAPGDALAQFEASDVAETFNISESQAKAALEAGLDSGQLEASTLIGAWIGTAAGALGLIGGIMGVANAKKVRGQQLPAAPPAAAAPPPADTTAPPAP